MIRGGLVQRNQGFGVYESSYNIQHRHGPGAPNHEERPYVFTLGPNVEKIDYVEPLKPENITRSDRSINYNDLFQRRPTDLVKQLSDILSRTVGKPAGPGGPSGPGAGLGGGSLGGSSLGPTITTLPPTISTTPPTAPPTPPPESDNPFSDIHAVTPQTESAVPPADNPFSDIHAVTPQTESAVPPVMEISSPGYIAQLPDPTVVYKIKDAIQEMDIVNIDAENLSQELQLKNEQLKKEAEKISLLSEKYEKLFYALTYKQNVRRKRDDTSLQPNFKKRKTTDADVYKTKLAIEPTPEDKKSSNELAQIANKIENSVNLFISEAETIGVETGQSDTTQTVKDLLKITFPEANFAAFEPKEKVKDLLKIKFPEANFAAFEPKEKLKKRSDIKKTPYTKPSRRSGGESQSIETTQEFKTRREKRMAEGEESNLRALLNQAKLTVKRFGKMSKDKISTNQWRQLQAAQDLIDKYQ